jgi:hypothetical protein
VNVIGTVSTSGYEWLGSAVGEGDGHHTAMEAITTATTSAVKRRRVPNVSAAA